MLEANSHFSGIPVNTSSSSVHAPTHAFDAQPQLILLDEPSLGLSPKLVEDIFTIIARINAPQPRVRKAVQNLLLTVGRLHPQALIYPLAVASHESRPRREAERSTAASPRPDGRQAAAATALPLFSMGRTSPRRGDAWRCPQ